MVCQQRRLFPPPACGDAEVWEARVLRQQRPPVAPTAGGLGGAALWEVRIARTPSIGGAFLFQSLLDRPLDGGEDGGVHLLPDLGFAIVREASTIEDLHRAIKVAAVMELLGMAHRDIPP
jgi:hypothetical protein